MLLQQQHPAQGLVAMYLARCSQHHACATRTPAYSRCYSRLWHLRQRAHHIRRQACRRVRNATAQHTWWHHVYAPYRCMSHICSVRSYCFGVVCSQYALPVYDEGLTGCWGTYLPFTSVSASWLSRGCQQMTARVYGFRAATMCLLLCRACWLLLSMLSWLQSSAVAGCAGTCFCVEP